MTAKNYRLYALSVLCLITLILATGCQKHATGPSGFRAAPQVLDGLFLSAPPHYDLVKDPAFLAELQQRCAAAHPRELSFYTSGSQASSWAAIFDDSEGRTATAAGFTSTIASTASVAESQKGQSVPTPVYKYRSGNDLIDSGSATSQGLGVLSKGERYVTTGTVTAGISVTDSSGTHTVSSADIQTLALLNGKPVTLQITVPGNAPADMDSAKSAMEQWVKTLVGDNGGGS